MLDDRLNLRTKPIGSSCSARRRLIRKPSAYSRRWQGAEHSRLLWHEAVVDTGLYSGVTFFGTAGRSDVNGGLSVRRSA